MDRIKQIVKNWKFGKESATDAMSKIYAIIEGSEYIPFDEFDLLKGKLVKRKGDIYKGELWEIVYIDTTCVWLLRGKDRMSKNFSSLYEDWEFEDGSVCGKRFNIQKNDIGSLDELKRVMTGENTHDHTFSVGYPHEFTEKGLLLNSYNPHNAHLPKT